VPLGLKLWKKIKIFRMSQKFLSQQKTVSKKNAKFLKE
jgi:hypothetical protein